jgi:hypothetical protein
MLRILAFFFVASTMTALAHAANWSSCADDLDSLKRASANASDSASEVKSKADAYERCRRYPDMYDPFKDGCRSEANAYRSAVSSFQGEMDEVNRRGRAVGASCSVDPAALLSPAGAGKPGQSPSARMCAMIRDYRGRLPEEDLMRSCLLSLPDAECRKCLAQ